MKIVTVIKNKFRSIAIDSNNTLEIGVMKAIMRREDNNTTTQEFDIHEEETVYSAIQHMDVDTDFCGFFEFELYGHKVECNFSMEMCEGSGVNSIGFIAEGEVLNFSHQFEAEIKSMIKDRFHEEFEYLIDSLEYDNSKYEAIDDFYRQNDPRN